MNYLERGHRPDLPAPLIPKTKAKSSDGSNPWPLPPLEIGLVREKYAFARFPDTSTLIDIAIHEKRNDDVVRPHESSMRNRLGFESYRDEEVAEAVKESHPDVAITIWKRLAEGQIKLVKPAAQENHRVMKASAGLLIALPRAGLKNKPPVPRSNRSSS